MFCQACGTQLQPAQHFCSTCGRSVSPDPFAAHGASQGRVRRHIQALGILWLVLSALQMVSGLVVLMAANTFLLTLEHGSYPAPLFVRPVIATITLLIAVRGALGVAAAVGLLKRATWARGLLVFLAFMSILELPFGTALAIYTLWVLRSRNADQEYRTLAAGG
jgi:hypothetical protein